MRKLTELETNALYALKEYGILSKPNWQFHGRTMNSLLSKGLITYDNYANGYFWRLTDSPDIIRIIKEDKVIRRIKK